jgi:hypothetical protein
MKKVLIGTNVFLLAVIIFQSCKIGGQGSSVLTPSCLKYNYSNVPFEGVEANLVQKSIADYRDFYSNRISINGKSQKDARSVWFSLEQLKNFIYHIEYNTCKNGCNKALGVRIYFLRYPDKNNWGSYPHLMKSNPDASYANLHSVLFIPTYFDGQYDSDFDPRRINNCIPEPMGKVMDRLMIPSAEGPGKYPSVFTLMSNGTSNSQTSGDNGGSDIPPPYEKIAGSQDPNFTQWLVPCHGAKLMNWVDKIDCGIIKVPKSDEKN